MGACLDRIVVDLKDQFFVKRQIVLFEGVFIPGHSVGGRKVLFFARNAGDRRVAFFKKIIRGRHRPFHIIDINGIEHLAPARHDDARDAFFAENLQLIIGHRRAYQNGAVDPSLARQPLEKLRLRLFLPHGVEQRNRIIYVAIGAFYALQDPHDKTRRQVRHDDADGIGFPRGQPPRDDIGIIVQLLGDLHHLFPGCLGNVGFVINDH